MAQLIDLEAFRRKLMADKGFRTWLSRFQEQFGPDTRLKDLSPATLLYLATPGEENLYVFFDLIMGACGLGGSARFRLNDLDSAMKLKIMDTAFALLDRVRFEVMRRLGWVEEVPDEEAPLITLVKEAWSQEAAFARAVPRLSPTRPEYDTYRKLPQIQQRVFIRRLIPRAVAEYQVRVENPPTES
ncbi:MAG: hypothetical protein JRI59_10355 [Deltaproteobacteria bacterium]|nr:hypothetical protein [Deltaproteobacteria bacterium]